MRSIAPSSLFLLTTLCAGGALAQPGVQRSYLDVTRDVAGMVSDPQARSLADKHGLSVVNVMWEDTGRSVGSSVGPNISDVTIEVEVEGIGGSSRHLMPVIRYPNFTDRTGDVDIEHFYLRVGNERQADGPQNGPLRTISLKQFLARPTAYMSFPDNGRIKGGSLLAERDRQVLTSAQSAFLPVPVGDKATFHPVLFNYQSSQGHPAVLTLLVTRQGTSMTIIDNARDTVGGGASWGQRLFFNQAGERAPLIAERLKDVQASGVTANGESAASLGKDANLLVMIQVPLKVKRPARPMFDYAYEMEAAPSMAPQAAPPSDQGLRTRGRSDLDVAVLGHGEAVGPYTELDGLTIERDDRFPVRATVQFYQATSNGVVSAADVQRMAEQIERVYAKADYVGSLVVPEEDVKRLTAHQVARANDGMWGFAGLVERFRKYGALSVGWYQRAFHW